jgi:hypothetical protein
MNIWGHVKRYKRSIKRWHIELMLLGLLITPIFFLFAWIQAESMSQYGSDLVRRALIGIVSGILGMAIWVLGASVIIINILKELLDEVKKISKEK